MRDGVHHVGLSVADLDAACAFYRDVLGLEEVVRRPFEGPRYEWILGLTRVEGRVALLRSGRLELELFEFARPAPGSPVPDRPVSDLGITHFCVEVADVDAEYRRLSAQGVRFHCPPIPFEGFGTATYGRDPDGNVFELIQTTRDATR